MRDVGDTSIVSRITRIDETRRDIGIRKHAGIIVFVERVSERFGVGGRLPCKVECHWAAYGSGVGGFTVKIVCHDGCEIRTCCFATGENSAPTAAYRGYLAFLLRQGFERLGGYGHGAVGLRNLRQIWC